MSSALLGILQLDRGEPWGFAELPGLVQAWLQDAGGFAALGLVVYLLYALSTPTDKSQSERLRVPVSKWMLLAGAISLICYAVVFVLVASGKGAPPEPPPPPPGESPPIVRPTWHKELRPTMLMVAGLFALLAIGEPFARDLFKIARRNVSFGLGGVKRYWRSLRAYAADLLTPRRVVALAGLAGAYALIGVALFALGVPRLTSIWTGVLVVAVGVFLAALFLLMLFEAEGPMWAVAKLSFKEAIRNQVLWIFLIGLLPFLFPIQWFTTSKPADEMRSATVLVTIFLSLLTLIPALLIASFGIPDDIKNLNIFTVVSKPIERFEIVLGRFVGYVALMTLVMLALTGVTLVLVINSGMSDKARAETYKARVPLRGKLEFKSIVAGDRKELKDFEGTNVGREFDYRKYIAGAGGSPQRAIWKFASIPGELRSPVGDRVPVEFTFDVYRMTKGEQDKGVLTKFEFVTHNTPLRQPALSEITKDVADWPWVEKKKHDDYLQAVREYQARGIAVEDQARARPGTEEWKAVNDLAERFGYYVFAGKEVLDYTVMGIEVPAGLFRNALANPPGKDGAGKPLPLVTVYVKCESEGQLLGAAEPDLYFLQNEMPYALNFLKGTLGLWCRLCIVIGVAVACSTYLSGVLTLLATAFIYIVGFFTDHLSELASNRAAGGGPFQSMSQLVKAEQPTAPLSETASTKALLFGDKGMAWLVRRLQNLIPDVDSFSWGHFVSEGFNVNTEYVVLNLIVTFGYLLPWGVLAYYLMKSREVAA
jgi:ABC-type transport system involved in multi-copper enzyme maturation permease subunit